MSRKYKFGDKDGAYFISFATINWIDACLRKINTSFMFFAKNLVHTSIKEI